MDAGFRLRCESALTHPVTVGALAALLVNGVLLWRICTDDLSSLPFWLLPVLNLTPTCCVIFVTKPPYTARVHC